LSGAGLNTAAGKDQIMINGKTNNLSLILQAKLLFDVPQMGIDRIRA
jgi:hypothetical protein